MSTIEQRVMANVGMIYIARQFVSVSALKFYAVVVAGFSLWQLTWIHRVLENWQQVGFSGTWSFITYALLHTSLPVQLALVILVGMGAWLLRDLMRPVRLRPAF